MNEMVERVASAMWWDNYRGRLLWEDQAPFLKDAYYNHARAAIAAMREPTGEMENAFYEEIYESAPAKWQAMIDAALAKAPSPAS